MKKTLVTLLALVFVLGIAGTAFAAPANPFVDVPAKHWAYGAVAKLAKAGVVDGYGDGTFRGDKTMTRYEMAQIVAKAMAKSEKADAEVKALVDKLAVEFAAELNNLGVRVAKLEKNASSIKFSGDARFRYTQNYSLDTKTTDAAPAPDRFQTRIRVKGEANPADNVSLVFRISGQNRISDNGTTKTKDLSGLNTVVEQYSAVQNDQLEFDLGYFTFKEIFPLTNLSMGRTYGFMGQGLLYDAPYYDAVRLSGGNVLKWDIGYGDNSFAPGPTASNWAAQGTAARTIKTANLSYNLNPDLNLTAAAMYGATQGEKKELYALGFNAKLSNDFALLTEWAKNNHKDAADTEKTALWVKLSYKGAAKATVGSYGLYVQYQKIGRNSIYDIGSLNNFASDVNGPLVSGGNVGTKGIGYGFNYTVAKNSVFFLEVEPLTSFDGNTKFKTFYNARLEWSF